MHVLKKIIKIAASVFLKEKIRIGSVSYTRWLLLPNLLSRTLKHEEFLDDIYMAVLKNKEGAIIDVGVNTGQTLFKMLSIDKNRSYFGFEPQSTPASCVESFLIENNIIRNNSADIGGGIFIGYSSGNIDYSKISYNTVSDCDIILYP